MYGFISRQQLSTVCYLEDSYKYLVYPDVSDSNITGRCDGSIKGIREKTNKGNGMSGVFIECL